MTVEPVLPGIPAQEQTRTVPEAPTPTPIEGTEAPNAERDVPSQNPEAPATTVEDVRGFAAAASHVEGNTPCERAYSNAASIDQATGERAPGAAIPRLIGQDEYMSICGELPEEAQRCILMIYRVMHRESCNPFQEELRVMRTATHRIRTRE